MKIALIMFCIVIAILPSVMAAYCGGPTKCNCGDLILLSQTMWYDLSNCNGNGLYVVSDVILDCGGHTISGDNSGNWYNRTYGIYSNAKDRVTITNCRVTGFYTGIIFEGNTTGTTISGNSVYNHSGLGIYLSGVNSSSILNNNASDTKYGIYLSSSSNNIIANNVANNNIEGISLKSGSSHNLIINNTVEYNSWAGIWVYLNSAYNLVQGNTMNYNSHGGIYLHTVNYNSVEENQCNNNGNCLRLYESNNNLLYNNTGNLDGIGIRVYDSDNNNFSQNSFFGGANGVFLENDADRNLVEKNSIRNSTNGININFGRWNNISGNFIEKCGKGIYTYLAFYNDISGNRFASNNYGAYVGGENCGNYCSDYENSIWNNSFENNNISAFETEDALGNIWYRDATGNYWSDFEQNPGYPDVYIIPSRSSHDKYPLNKLIDLQVVEFAKLYPDAPTNEDEIMFYYQIFNYGYKDAKNLSFRIITDSSVPDIISSAAVNVPHNSSYFGYVHWKYPAAGTYNPRFQIDYNNNYNETNESNNEKTAHLVVTGTATSKPASGGSPIFMKPRIMEE